MALGSDSHPIYGGGPAFAYDTREVQEHYTGREFWQVRPYLEGRLQPGMNVLDCGCGPGTLTLGLAQAVEPDHATGIDIEPSMVDTAIGLAEERGVSNVEFRVDDITDLSFADDRFDLVFTSAVGSDRHFRRFAQSRLRETDRTRTVRLRIQAARGPTRQIPWHRHRMRRVGTERNIQSLRDEKSSQSLIRVRCSGCTCPLVHTTASRK